MAGERWAPEEDALLRELYPTMGNREVARLVSEACGTRRTKDGVCVRARLLGLSKDQERGYRKPQPRRLWDEERAAWLRAFAPGHSQEEIAAEHERVFGWRLTMAQVKNGKVALGVKSGTTGGQFQKGLTPFNKGRHWDEYLSPEKQERARGTTYKAGHRPHNQGELLDERFDARDGYWQVKVDPRNAPNSTRLWISRARFRWMQANGRDWPEGHKALHVDGDKENDDPENIVPVPNDLWPLVMGAAGKRTEYFDRESAEVAITSARITRAITRSKRGRRQHGNN